MSNFYTDYELPIITVRQGFFPHKTSRNLDTTSLNSKRLNSIDLASKLIIPNLMTSKYFSV